MNVMPIPEVIDKVAAICRKNGTFAADKFQDIIKVYYPLFEKLRDDVEKYYRQGV